MPETTLDMVETSNKATVIRVSAGSARRRIMDMGVIPGAEIEVIRRAPLGDPIEFRVKGYNLSLRKREAKGIIVKTS